MIRRLGLAGLPMPAVGGLGGALVGLILVLAAGQVSPLLAAGAVLGLLVVAAVVVSPALGLYLTALVIPIERLGRFTEDSGTAVDVSLMRVIGTAALASMLLHALLKRERFRFGTPFALYGAYCGLAAVGVLYALEPPNALRYTVTVLGNLTFFFLLLNAIRSWRHARIAVLLWLAASVGAGAYTVYVWHFGDTIGAEQIGTEQARGSIAWRDAAEWETLGEERRALGPTSAAATYAINLILTFPFLAYLFRIARNWAARIAILTSTALLAYNLLLTNTRLAVLCAAAVFVLSVARGLVVMTPGRLFAIIGLGVAVSWFAGGTALVRALDPANYTVAHSATLRIRWEYWQAALEIVQAHWLTGTGVGTASAIPRLVKNEYVGPTASAHNEYLQTLIEVGVPGALVFFGFVALILWHAIRAARIFRRLEGAQEQYWFMVACQIATMSVLAFGVAVDVFHFPLKGWWLVAGLSCVMHRFARVTATPPVRPLPAAAPDVRREA